MQPAWVHCGEAQKNATSYILIFDEGLMNFIVSSDAACCIPLLFFSTSPPCDINSQKRCVLWKSDFPQASKEDWTGQREKVLWVVERALSLVKALFMSFYQLLLIHSRLNCIFTSQFANKALKIRSRSNYLSALSCCSTCSLHSTIYISFFLLHRCANNFPMQRKLFLPQQPTANYPHSFSILH